MSEHRVSVDNGKYTFVFNERIGDWSTVDILRHGSQWITIHDGTNALHSIMTELDAVRVVLAEARILCNNQNFGTGKLKEALEKHDRLCDDREPPSEWTK